MLSNLSASSRAFALFACAVSLTFHLGCSGSAGMAKKEAEPPVVICVEAIGQEIIDYDEFVGRTEASESVDVTARVSGYLRTVDFDDGQLVEQGQTLATIESDEYEAIHAQAVANVDLWKAKLTLAEATKRRFAELRKTDAISQSEFDESVAAVQEAESQIAAAEAATLRTSLDVAYCTVAAPISGRVDRAYMTPGNMVTGGLGKGTLLTRIVNDSPMYAYIDVDEQSVLAYKRRVRSEGRSRVDASGSLKDLEIPCYLQLQDEDDFPHEGLLDFAENRVDAATGTIQIRGVFPNTDKLLQGGLFVRVRIPKGDPFAGVLIPEQCIAMDQADKIAFVVGESGQVERRTIQVGSRIGGFRSVKSGIQAGEKVVYKGLQRIRPGAQVKPAVEEIAPPRTQSTGSQPTGSQPTELGPAESSPAESSPATPQ